LNTFRERARLSSKIVKVSITTFQSQKLIGYDTLESGTQQSTIGFSLGNGTNK
jgi:hypothetical protein